MASGRVPVRGALLAGLLLAAAYAGCLASPGESLPTPVPQGSACGAGQGFTAVGLQGCRWIFEGDDKQQLEAHLAIDPGAPEHVAVTWTERGSASWGASVRVAMSSDAGRTWTISRMAAQRTTPGLEQSQWDSTASFRGPGTVHILFVDDEDEPDGRFGWVNSRLMVATSTDDGQEWSYSPVIDLPGFVWDYPQIASAPDQATMYATARDAGAGVWFFRSGDAGATWEPGRPLDAEQPGQEIAVTTQTRTAAGTGGLVVVAYGADLDVYKSVSQPPLQVLWSDDAGTTFQRVPEGERPYDQHLFGYWPATRGDGHSGQVVVPVAEGARRGFVSLSHGRQTDDPVVWFPEAATEYSACTIGAGWMRLAGLEDGTIYALHRVDAAEAPRWSIVLDRVSGVEISSAELAGTADAFPFCRDDYGGLAVASDGTLWASWSQVGSNGVPAVVVARMQWVAT